MLPGRGTLRPGSGHAPSARSVAGALRSREGVELRQVYLTELEVSGAGVVGQVFRGLGPGDRHDVPSLGEHTGQRDLRRGGPGLRRDLLYPPDDRQVGPQRVLLEARQPAAEVVLGQVVEGREPAGEEAAAER